MQQCVSEYISFITGEANEGCQREQRKTITAEDLLWAMGKLGFENYIQPLTVYLNRYREVESERTSRGEAYKRHVDFVLAPPQPQPFGVPPYVPAFQMGYNPAGMFDAAAAMGGYYRDGGSGAGGSSSQVPMANFDPYAEYK
ncbi:hypothetical protein L1049_019707 [Liquidambar formosana]|uniref:Transcription factor CBF/NF-Y/archaeal histone domain-containing protein n=1 Tax=Liquidambar formosana TaxID=63359 RepID=A0AAP0X6Q6_LIQFO